MTEHWAQHIDLPIGVILDQPALDAFTAGPATEIITEAAREEGWRLAGAVRLDAYQMLVDVGTEDAPFWVSDDAWSIAGGTPTGRVRVCARFVAPVAQTKSTPSADAG